jgi:histidinol-phosphatase (PHP family)
MDAWSKEILWDVENPKDIYQAYYDQAASAIQSGLFTQIGHPDVIKMYQYDPGYDLTEEYERLAALAAAHHVKLEENTGAHYRYGHPEAGLTPAFRQAIKKHGAETIAASDAHVPAHVGKDYEFLPG